MLFISYICYGGSYPHPKGCVLATADLSISCHTGIPLASMRCTIREAFSALRRILSFPDG